MTISILLTLYLIVSFSIGLVSGIESVIAEKNFRSGILIDYLNSIEVVKVFHIIFIPSLFFFYILRFIIIILLKIGSITLFARKRRDVE